MTIKDNIVLYKLFEKRDKFSLFIVWIPYLLSNIPSSESFLTKGTSFLYLLYVCLISQVPLLIVQIPSLSTNIQSQVWFNFFIVLTNSLPGTNLDKLCAKASHLYTRTLTQVGNKVSSCEIEKHSKDIVKLFPSFKGNTRE